VVDPAVLYFPVYSESKENLPFSVARNIKALLNKNIENLKSVQFDHNTMKMIKKC